MPMMREPLSPINILAGEKLKIKKPNSAPDNENESDANVYSLANTNQAPKTEAAIKPIPAANPSTPSIRFMAFTTTM